MDNYLSLKNISKKYNEFFLDNISYDFRKGKTYYIVGSNGAGKTTLLDIIAGLIFPDTGEIRYFNKYLKFNEYSVKNRMGFVPNYMAFPMHVNIKFLADLYSEMYELFSKRLFYQHVASLGITDREKKVVKMSDGMKKKILVSLVLAYSPDIFIADEIVNSLDESAICYICNCLKRLQESKGTLIILSTPIQNKLLFKDSSIIFKDQGRILQ